MSLCRNANLTLIIKGPYFLFLYILKYLKKILVVEMKGIIDIEDNRLTGQFGSGGQSFDI